MAEEMTVYWGYWWLPGEDPGQDAQQGSLTIGPDETMRLESVGGFPVGKEVPIEGEPGASTVRHTSLSPVIFGGSGSHQFTLLGTSI
ncbi:MAG: hypothetical protein QOH14_1375 [Pseudonocardiales bacterium]|jgi:hypothetical protein|nr:hypothetical protein [Pseudonocardiales bacterium]